jgi:hypothetical protein
MKFISASTTTPKNLGPLQSLRILAVCIQVEYWEGDAFDGDNQPDIWTSFAWLLQVLKTAQNFNSIEEIVVKIVHLNSREYEFLPDGFCGHFRWLIFGPLLAKRFPRLCKVKLLLQADYMPVLRRIIDVEHPFAVDLVKTGILEVKELEPCGKYHFWAWFPSSKVPIYISC